MINSLKNSMTFSPSDYLLSSYDYHLPPELIAQNPVSPRDESRLLVVNSPHTHHHCLFKELSQWLNKGDLLVVNNTRVIPARLYGKKTTGSPIEILLLEQQELHRWLCLVKPGKRFKMGTELEFSLPPESDPQGCYTLRATVVDRDDATGGRVLQFIVPEGQNFYHCLEKLGQVPLPPYIHESSAQFERYQTIYAEKEGAVAAPTAGLHFTDRVFADLKTKGIEVETITLHVGIGTFRPVEVENITEHKIHAEWAEITPETVAKIKETKARGGRVIAVGTTVTRTLETLGQKNLEPFTGKTDLFIYPGYEWKVVDGLITNFHLPKSSLMMLVSALITRERLLEVYQIAIEEKYRFYSFGDAMLLLP